MTNLVILDFDGTFTDLDTESAPFRQGYFADLAALVGRPLDEVTARALHHEGRITAEPEKYGWMHSSTSTHVATIDPYIRLAPITRMLLDEYGHAMSNDDVVRRAIACWKDNYHLTVASPVFKHEAGDVLHAIAAQLPSWVVTNSATDHVQTKIHTLAATTTSLAIGGLADRTAGWARKYEIDDACDVVERHLILPGLSARNVDLRRPQYYAALNTIRQQHDVAWSDMTVVGDGFEIDLALPFALGCTVALVTSQHTPKYELDFVRSCGRGHVIDNLTEVLPVLGL